MEQLSVRFSGNAWVVWSLGNNNNNYNYNNYNNNNYYYYSNNYNNNYYYNYNTHDDFYSAIIYDAKPHTRVHFGSSG